MLKTSDFTECYVIEFAWSGNIKEATVRVKVTQKNIYKKYLKTLSGVYIIYDDRTDFIYTYPSKTIHGENDEHVRYVYCEKFVDAYRIIDDCKTQALRLISMVKYRKQNGEMGFDNLAYVDFGNEKINIDDYLQ